MPESKSIRDTPMRRQLKDVGSCSRCSSGSIREYATQMRRNNVTRAGRIFLVVLFLGASLNGGRSLTLARGVVAALGLTVENALFKVPSWQFERNSGLSIPSVSIPPTGAEGSDESNPFILHGISRAAFQALLKVLYPLSALPQTPTLLDHEWISVLNLATLWGFIEVRELATNQLTSYANSLDCIWRILLGRQHKVSSWLRSGYTVRRKAPITSEEAAKIGFEVVLQIFHLREAAIAPETWRNPFQSVSLGTVFEAEFAGADSVPKIRVFKTAPSHTASNVFSFNTPPPRSTAVFGSPTPLATANTGTSFAPSTIRDGGFGKFAGPPGAFHAFPKPSPGTNISFNAGGGSTLRAPTGTPNIFGAGSSTMTHPKKLPVVFDFRTNYSSVELPRSPWADGP
ncbi:hypothetical protein C8R46DRAFT_1205928 [Mycena filopes]|nr:hypothetical protein C8R46DRAFT_1205928 [Mycena filopes]